jgi:hypothetical protein
MKAKKTLLATMVIVMLASILGSLSHASDTVPSADDYFGDWVSNSGEVIRIIDTGLVYGARRAIAYKCQTQTFMESSGGPGRRCMPVERLNVAFNDQIHGFCLAERSQDLKRGQVPRPFCSIALKLSWSTQENRLVLETIQSPSLVAERPKFLGIFSSGVPQQDMVISTARRFAN